MPRQYHHLRALVLKKHPLGEADYRVTLFTDVLGKIEAIARGARKITSNFSGHLESINIGFFQLYESPQRFSIIQAQTVKNFKKIRENLQASLLALTLIEIVEKSTSREVPSPEILMLIEKTLDQFENGKNFLLTMESFKLKLMDQLGVLPDMTSCSFCHQRWRESDSIWISSEGHLGCDDCKQTLLRSYFPVEFKIIKLICFLLKQDHIEAKIMLLKKQEEDLKKINQLFLANYLNQAMSSERYFSQSLSHSSAARAERP